jgi:hypothetical protein
MSTSLYGNIPSSIEDDDIDVIKDSQLNNNISGAVSVEQLDITTTSGTVTLLDSYVGIVVEESIFTSFIVGAIMVQDNTGGLEKFQLRGGEPISLKVSKTQSKEVLIWRQDLYVTRIGKSSIDPVSGIMSYALYFAPRSFILSTKKKFYKPYKNISVKDAVESIYADISFNNLFIEDPKLTLTKPYFPSGMMPHKVIDELAKRSCSKNKHFVFFERFIPVYGTKGTDKFSSTHYFGSLDKLIQDSTQGNLKIISYVPKTNRNIERGIRGDNLRTRDNFNHMAALSNGFYNTKIESINPISRKYSTQTIGYTLENLEEKEFYQNHMIDSNNIFNVFDNTRNETPSKKLVMSSVNEVVSVDSWLKEFMYGRMTKTYFQILIDIQGGTNQIDVGHVVGLYVPSITEKRSDVTNPNPMADKVFSGRYLVSGARHVIKNGTYIKTLELSRGSSPFNLNTTLSENDILRLTDSVISRMLSPRKG